MVGKVNLPPDAEKRKDVKGAATDGAGLTAVDEERAASMADEGGASGAEVEGRPKKKKKKDVDDEKSPGRRGGR